MDERAGTYQHLWLPAIGAPLPIMPSLDVSVPAIATIARRRGFANASAFTRAFRRFFSDSPSDIRME